MKFGLRTPSLKKRISARTSLKRYARHSMGLKAPRGMGIITNPKKAIYNKVYNKTTFGIGDIAKSSSSKKSKAINTTQSYKPINNNEPVSISPRSFIELINTPDKFSKDGRATVIIIFGIIFLFANPILGLPMIIGGGYWFYKISKSPQYRVEKNFKQAKKLLKSNKFSEALPLLKEAIKNDRNNLSLHYLLGVTQHATGEYVSSIKNLLKFSDSNPDDLDAKLILAYSYYKEKKFKKTVSILQQFPQDYPDYLLIIILLGDSFIGLREYEMAIDVFKRGPLRKRNFNSYLVQLHYLLGVAYKANGKKANALKEFKRVYAFDMDYQDVTKEISELEK